MGILSAFGFGSRPEAKAVERLTRQEHLDAIGKLLTTDLDTERQSLVLGNIAQLYTLVRALPDKEEAIYYRFLSRLQESVEANKPGTRDEMIRYLRILRGRENDYKAKPQLLKTAA